MLFIFSKQTVLTMASSNVSVSKAGLIFMDFYGEEIFRVSPVFGNCFYFPVNMYSYKQRNRCNQIVLNKKSQDLQDLFYNSTVLIKNVSCHSVYEY